MFRRVVVIVVLPLLLLTRSALLGHAHGMNGEGKRWMQHVHIAPLVYESRHDVSETANPHRNSHGHHHHTYCGFEHLDDDADKKSLLEPAHDETEVVKIVVDDALAEDASSWDAETDPWVESVTVIVNEVMDGNRRHSSCRGHPPPESMSPRCALHLLHLVLVI